MKTILTLAVASLLAVPTWAQGQPGTNEINPEIAEMLSTNPPAKGFATRLDYIKSFTSEKKIIDAYHSGKIDKNEAMLAMELNPVAPGDKVLLDTYGKVVDQDGQPVVDAKVQANVETSFSDSTDYHTKTDAQGLFHFLGLHGQGLGIELQKDGYYFNYMLPSAQRPGNYLPDPSNPMVLTMWKLHGAEPIKHAQLHAYIPCDGTVTRFDLLTGKKNSGGDLSVSLARNPLNIERQKPFAWTLTLQITNGGFQNITNIYPYEAPSNGYQSSMIFHYESGSSNWTSQIQPQLYFKGNNGQIYGRMTLKVMTDFQPPPTLFDADIYANPAGSRNLEYEIPK